jgi:hypothetical protein
MKRIFALLLLASPIIPAATSFAIGQEVKYITPEIPTEEEKIAALKLAYELNGNSMVRRPELGSIDLSGPNTTIWPDAPLPKADRVIPLTRNPQGRKTAP